MVPTRSWCITYHAIHTVSKFLIIRKKVVFRSSPHVVLFIKLTLAPTIKNYDPKQKFYSIAHNFAIPASKLEYWKQSVKLESWRLTTNLLIHAVYPSCPVSARSFLSSSSSFSRSVSHSRTLWRTCVSSPVTCKLYINCAQHCVIGTQISSVKTMKNKTIRECQTTHPMDNSPQTTRPRPSDNSPPIFRKLAPNLQTSGLQFQNTYVTLDKYIFILIK